MGQVLSSLPDNNFLKKISQEKFFCQRNWRYRKFKVQVWLMSNSATFFSRITLFLEILQHCEYLKASAPRSFRWTVSGFSEHNKQSWLLRIATENYLDFFCLGKDENHYRIDYLDSLWDCSNCYCWIRYLTSTYFYTHFYEYTLLVKNKNKFRNKCQESLSLFLLGQL